MFDEKKILKQYLAITKNIPRPAIGEIDIPLIRREVNDYTKVIYFGCLNHILNFNKKPNQDPKLTQTPTLNPTLSLTLV